MRAKLIALLLIAVGPFLAITSYQRKSEIAKINAEGETVPGVIEGGSTRSKRGSKTYKFEVVYTTKAGAKQQQEFTGHGAFVDQHLRDNTIYQPLVEVRYLAADPAKAILVGNDEDPTTKIYIGIGLIPVGLIVAFFAFRKKATPPEATAAPAPSA